MQVDVSDGSSPGGVWDTCVDWYEMREQETGVVCEDYVLRDAHACPGSPSGLCGRWWSLVVVGGQQSIPRCLLGGDRGI
jgi:hypothetical protein